MPIELVELDQGTPFGAQLQTDGAGEVVLINLFAVAAAEDVDAFLEAWSEHAAVMKEQPGFVSTQLHRGAAKSLTFANVAVWESAADLRAAVSHPRFRESLGKYPDGSSSSPHMFHEIAVPGICGHDVSGAARAFRHSAPSDSETTVR